MLQACANLASSFTWLFYYLYQFLYCFVLNFDYLLTYIAYIMLKYVSRTWKNCLWYRFPTLNWNYIRYVCILWNKSVNHFEMKTCTSIVILYTEEELELKVFSYLALFEDSCQKYWLSNRVTSQFDCSSLPSELFWRERERKITIENAIACRTDCFSYVRIWWVILDNSRRIDKFRCMYISRKIS